MALADPPSSALRVAIFGATSDIALAVARLYAEQGAALALVGRDQAALARAADDLRVRGASGLSVQTADFGAIAALDAVADAAWGSGLDIALIAYGTLPDQAACNASTAAAEAALRLNFTSPALLSQRLAQHFEAARGGTLAVITSVAGDRGRQSNYVYGSAKGGLQRLLQGLRHRLFPAGVNVLDIRPGFVASKMTAHLPQKGPLWAQPDKVAGQVVAAIRRRRAVLYTPGFWRLIMTVITSVPNAVFHRTKL